MYSLVPIQPNSNSLMPSCGIKQCRLPYTRNFEIFEISSSLTASIWLYDQNNWQKTRVVLISLLTTNYLFIAHQAMEATKF